MVDDDIRILDLTQGLSSMTFLSARFLARRLPQALGPGRFVSLEGGLPLLLLFNPSRRSNSATRAFDAASAFFNAAFSASNAAIRSFCAALCASSS
jgi:hypothetical protein